MHARVLPVAGNQYHGLGLECTRVAVRTRGGHCLHDGESELRQAGTQLQLHADESVRAAGEQGCVHASAAHHPRIIEVAAQHYDFVFAGDLHGGQCGLWDPGRRLDSGAWFSRWNQQRFAKQGTALMVSRGVADTPPVRFRCPRDVACREIAGTCFRSTTSSARV